MLEGGGWVGGWAGGRECGGGDVWVLRRWGWLGLGFFEVGLVWCDGDGGVMVVWWGCGRGMV